MAYNVNQSQRLNEFDIHDDTTKNYGVADGAILIDPTTGLPYNAADNYVWDAGGLQWVKMTQPAGGGGGPATIADGADVAQGTTSDAAWVSGSGTVISLLKKIASAGGSAVTIADGADTAEGTTADAAVVTDVSGTVSGKLRGLVKIFASVWDSANGRLKVDASAVTVPVSNAGLTNIDVALSTRLKPADTLSGVATVGAVTSITNALPAGANLLGSVGIDQTTPGLTNKVSVGADVVHTVVDSGSLPTNAAKETGGNLDIISTYSLPSKELSEQILVELKVISFLLNNALSTHVDLDDLRNNL